MGLGRESPHELRVEGRHPFDDRIHVRLRRKEGGAEVPRAVALPGATRREKGRRRAMYRPAVRAAQFVRRPRADGRHFLPAAADQEGQPLTSLKINIQNSS